MLQYLSRSVLAGLFLLPVSAWLTAGEQPPEVLKVAPAPAAPNGPLGVLPGIPPGPLAADDFSFVPGDHLPPHAVIGVREIGCYHACPEYYSPYHVRPWIEPAIAASMVRSQLAHLGIKVNAPDNDNAKDKDLEKGKVKEKDKEANGNR